MADDLQALLNRLQAEGVQRAEQEKARIVAEARKEAEALLQAARAEAAALTAAAKTESAKLQRAAEDNIRQAARDVQIALHKELDAQLTRLLHAAVGEAMRPAQLADLLRVMVERYSAGGGAVTRVEVLVPPELLKELESRLKGTLGKHFHDGLVLRPVPGLRHGIKVAFNGQSVCHDLSPDAIVELLGAYLNPRVLALLRGAAKEG